MSEVTNAFLSTQILLSLSFLFLWVLSKHNKKISFSNLLQFSYFLIFSSVVLPIIGQGLPGKNPFGPIVKVWTELSPQKRELLSGSSLNFHFPSTTVTPYLSGALPLNMGALLGVIVLGFMVWNLAKIIRSYLSLAELLRSSYPLKEIGGVKIWVSQDVASPFSFFNGSAHVVLPCDVLSRPIEFNMAVIHELQHHRQKDTIWIYFLEVVKLVFSINPFVKRLMDQTMELQELACDEYLVGHRKLSPHLYGKCLFDFAEKQLLKQHTLAGAVGMAAETKFLKRRIETMFQQKRDTSKRTLASLLFFGFLTITGAAWAVRGVISDQRISLNQAHVLAKKASSQQEIPIVVDSSVLYWLNKAVGTESSRRYMRESLVRMQSYEEMIRQKLTNANLPIELLAVPLVESGFRNNYESTAKANGIWQFIASTARRCGLDVNPERDERLNPERLTDAAVCYYQKLHAIFQNWHVAISAYNIGESAMMKAISQERHNDAFKLAKEGHLGKEGKNYLPKIMAGMIILNNPGLVQ